MEAATSEAVAVSQRSEREYLALRESVAGLVEGWKGDVKELRGEMKKREERWSKDAEETGAK